jgi:peroxiredoxin Q/BCP
MAGPREGDQAPDFTLEGTDGPFRLSDHRGERVVLLFYPADDSTVCTKQFCSYRDNAPEIEGLDATVVGISGQGLESKEAFIRKHGLTAVPLLADTDLEVARLFGVHQRLLGTKRAVFVIDGEGVVRHRHLNTLSLTYDDIDSLKSALAGVPA